MKKRQDDFGAFLGFLIWAGLVGGPWVLLLGFLWLLHRLGVLG